MVWRMEAMGLCPTIREFCDIVADYLNNNEIYTRFEDNKPGKDWTQAFMKRHKIVLKRGGMMQLARKTVTADPFVIYGFYDILEKEINCLGIADRPECVYNCNEYGFAADHKQSITMEYKGIKTVRLMHGSIQENIMVLSTCCANGKALDPLIIFKGKNFQSIWEGDEALQTTHYAVSESGWMTKDIFEEYFKKFAEATKTTRPLLLIIDSLLRHTSLATEELAIKENISILKLPADCRDLLQPLHMAYITNLKYHHDQELSAYVRTTNAREALRKITFINMLCKAWKKGLSSKIIMSAFKATGIAPVDRSKYNTNRLDKMKITTYNTWVLAGKQTDDLGNAIMPLLESSNVEEDENEFEPVETEQQTFKNEKMTTPLPTVSPVSSTSGLQMHTARRASISTPNVIKRLADATMEQLIAEIQKRGKSTS